MSDVLSLTDTVFDTRDAVFEKAEAFLVDAASDILPEWSASFLLKWPEEDWGACGLCEQPECQGNWQMYSSDWQPDIDRCDRYSHYCNREGTCQGATCEGASQSD